MQLGSNSDLGENLGMIEHNCEEAKELAGDST